MKANRDEKLSLGHLASSVLKAYHLLSYLSHVFQKDKVEVNLKTNLQADKSTETNTDTRTETQLFMRTANRLATSKASKTGTGKSFRQKVVIRTQIWLAKKHRFYNHFRKTREVKQAKNELLHAKKTAWSRNFCECSSIQIEFHIPNCSLRNRTESMRIFRANWCVSLNSSTRITKQMGKARSIISDSRTMKQNWRSNRSLSKCSCEIRLVLVSLVLVTEFG